MPVFDVLGGEPARAGQNDNPSVYDWTKEVAAAGADLLGQVGSSTQYGGERLTGEGDVTTGRSMGDVGHGLAEYLRSTQTPAMQDTRANPDDHFWANVGQQGAALAPVIGGFMLAPEGVAAEALGGAGLQGGQLVDHVINTTNQMSDSELEQASPVFKQYIDDGMDAETARRQLHKDMISNPDLTMSLFTGAIAGGLAGRLLRGQASKAFGDGLVSRTLTGGLEGAAAGAGSVAQIDYAMQDADVMAGMRNEVDYGEVAKNALATGATFGVLGAGLGALPRGGSGRTARVAEVDEIGRDPSIDAALGETQPAPPAAQVPAAEAPPAATPPISVPGKKVTPADFLTNPDALDLTGAQSVYGKRLGPTEEVTPPTANDPQGTVAESRATLEAQRQQLVNGERPAVLIPKGGPRPVVPDGMKSMITKDGFVIYDPNKLKASDIRQAVANNQMGQLLGLGDVNKQEVAQRVAAGEQPTAVVERQPDGTEVRAAAGTDQTAPGQQAQMEEVATPGNTVGQETPENVINTRQEAVQAERTPEVQANKETAADLASKLTEQPTPEQAESGDYIKGRADWEGHKLAIETPKGGTRTAKDGSWEVKDYPAHYGYIEKTKGADGDEVDIFVGPSTKSRRVFLIDQIDPATGKFDEHKAMVGFDSVKEAKDTYEKAFSDGSAPDRIGAITSLTTDNFNSWLKNGDTTKPHNPERLKSSNVVKAREKAAAQKVSEAPKPAGPRVLQDLTQKVSKEAKPVAGRVENRTGAHESKAMQEKRRQDMATIADILKNQTPENFKPVETKAERGELETRLDKMIKQLASDGVKINTKVGYDNRPGEQIYARDAQQMLTKLQKFSDAEKVPKKFQDDIVQFLLDEQFARHGDFEAIRERRGQVGEDIGAAKRAEGKETTSEPEVIPERASEDLNPEEHLAAKSEDPSDTTAAVRPEDEFKQELAAGRERKVELKGDEVTAGKSATGSGVVVETRKGRKINRVALRAADDSEGSGKTISLNDDYLDRLDDKDYKGVQRLDRTQLSNVTGLTSEDVGKNYNMIANAVWNHLKKTIGEVPVHIVSDAAMQKLGEGLTGRKATFDGFYDPVSRHIVVSDRMVKDGKIDTRLMVHEGLHAGFMEAAEGNAKLRGILEEMRTHVEKEWGHVLDALGDNSGYGLTNIHEFISEAFANPSFQEVLDRTELPRSLRAKLDALPDRGTTMWDLLKALVTKYVPGLQKLLGTADGPSVLDGLMRAMNELESTNAAISRIDGQKRGAYTKDIEPLFRQTVTKPAEVGERYTGRAADIQKALGAAVSKLKPGANLKRAARQFLTLDQLRQNYEGWFPKDTFRKHEDLMNSSDAFARNHAHAGENLAREMARLQAKNTGPKWQGFAELLNDARVAQVHPDREITAPGNEHLADATYAQGKAQFNDLRKRYNALPADLKELWGKTVDFYAKDRMEHARALLDTALEGTGIGPEVKNRIHEGKATEADRKLLTEKLEDEDAVNAILNEEVFQASKGAYTPLSRRGDFVVQATRAVAEPKGGKVMAKGNGYEFTSEAERDAFLKDLGNIPSETKERNYDPDTGRRVKDEDLQKYSDKKKYPDGVDKRWEVSYDPAHVEMFESQADAKTAIENMRRSGDFSNVKGERRKNEFQAGELSSRAMQALVSRLGQGKSAAAKAALAERMQEARLAVSPGNRMMKHQLKARRISGADRDVVRNLMQYNTSSSRALARSKFEPEIEANLDKMRLHNKITEDDKTLARDDVLKAIEQRMHGAFAVAPGNGLTSVLNTGMSVSFLKHMMSPAYLMVQMTHPGMISLPTLGARHGFAKTSLALARAYKDMGPLGAFSKAAGSASAKARDVTAKGTNFVDYFKSKLSNASDSADIGRMLQTMTDLGYIHPEAGMEVHRMDPGRNTLMRGLDRVDGAFREFTSAAESINRVVEAITAYRLEKAKTGSHEAAVRYAGDTIANNQGMFTKANSSPIFNNKYARPFLQFKQYAQMMYHLLGRQVVNVFKGESKEVKLQAAKTLAGLLITHGTMAGALGLPLELGKTAVMVAHALGLTGTTWQDLENAFQEDMAKRFGPLAGEVISRGITRGLGGAAFDVSGRMGLDSMLSFGEPKSDKPEDTMSFIMNTLGGAPVSLVQDNIRGVQNMVNGDFTKAVEALVPSKVLADVAKAYRLSTEGKPTKQGGQGMKPIGPVGAVLQGLGFKPGAAAEYDEARSAVYNAKTELKDARNELITSWVSAKGADKAKAMTAITKFNQGKAPGDRITMSQLSSRAKSVVKENILGFPAGKRDKPLLEEKRKLYNAG